MRIHTHIRPSALGAKDYVERQHSGTLDMTFPSACFPPTGSPPLPFPRPHHPVETYAIATPPAPLRCRPDTAHTRTHTSHRPSSPQARMAPRLDKLLPMLLCRPEGEGWDGGIWGTAVRVRPRKLKNPENPSPVSQSCAEWLD